MPAPCGLSSTSLGTFSSAVPALRVLDAREVSLSAVTDRGITMNLQRDGQKRQCALKVHALKKDLGVVNVGLGGGQWWW